MTIYDTVLLLDRPQALTQEDWDRDCRGFLFDAFHLHGIPRRATMNPKVWRDLHALGLYAGPEPEDKARRCILWGVILRQAAGVLVGDPPAHPRLFEIWCGLYTRREQAAAAAWSFLSALSGTIPSAEDRALLGLPGEGRLKESEIRAAYRRMAAQAHPDAGGNAEAFYRLTAARDRLLHPSTAAPPQPPPEPRDEVARSLWNQRKEIEGKMARLVRCAERANKDLGAGYGKEGLYPDGLCREWALRMLDLLESYLREVGP